MLLLLLTVRCRMYDEVPSRDYHYLILELAHGDLETYIRLLVQHNSRFDVQLIKVRQFIFV